MKVQFVCLGNICRSAAAEAIFNQMIEEAQLTDCIEVSSAGTGAMEGDSADHRMVKHASNRGCQINHRAIRFRKSDLSKYDLIIVMDEDNYEHVDRMATSDDERSKIYMMTDFCVTRSDSYVPDPYYGESSDFEMVMDILEESCNGLLQFIRTKTGI